VPFIFSSLSEAPAVDLRLATYTFLHRRAEATPFYSETITKGFLAGFTITVNFWLELTAPLEYCRDEFRSIRQLRQMAARVGEPIRADVELLPTTPHLVASEVVHLALRPNIDLVGEVSGVRILHVTAFIDGSDKMDLAGEIVSADPAILAHRYLRTTAALQSSVGIAVPSRGDSFPPVSKQDHVVETIDPQVITEHPEVNKGAADERVELSLEDMRQRLKDDVVCSVFARPRVAAGEQFALSIFLHKQDELIVSVKKAMRRDPEARRRAFEILKVKILPGSTIDFYLDSEWLLVKSPLREVVWRSSVEIATFEVAVPGDFTENVVTGTVIVSSEGIPIAEIPFEIAVTPLALQAHRAAGFMSAARPAPGIPEALPVSVAKQSKRYSKAFLSYSRKDVAWASILAEGLAESGVDLFVDVTAMEPGDDWKNEIYNAIDGADVFFLLWSENAANSAWVSKECSHACDRWHSSGRRAPAIRPIILQESAPKPPFCIPQFHCDSKWRHMRVAGGSPLFRK